jgi:hypothetical protein
MGMFLLRFEGTGFGSSRVGEVWALTDASSGYVGRFCWAALRVVSGVDLGACCGLVVWWWYTCEEHVFANKAGEALF